MLKGRDLNFFAKEKSRGEEGCHVMLRGAGGVRLWVRGGVPGPVFQISRWSQLNGQE